MNTFRKWVLLLAFAYVTVAFCSWELDPAKWSSLGRAFFFFINAAEWALVLINNARRKAYKELQEKSKQREAEVAEANRRKGGFASVLQKQLDKAEEAKKVSEN